MMLEIFAILLALFAGFLTTRIYYKKQISKMEAAHEVALQKEFHATFEAAWVEGINYGKHLGRMEILGEKAKSKK